MMDLYINTLTGTVFELRVNPFEAVLSIKAKLQRLEGISISQQHLIWKSKELDDECCLHDYGIKNGATLTLVLAMRDGPINMRRVSIDEPSMEEVAEYVDANREEIWDKIMNDDKQVTLLVFRDGDQLNFFRVYDRGDGTLSPYSDSFSPESIYNTYPDEDSIKLSEGKTEDNLVTRNKMKILRTRMQEKSSKKTQVSCQPPKNGVPNSELAKRRLHLSKSPSVLCRYGVIPKTESKLNIYEGTPSPHKLDVVKGTNTECPPTHQVLPPIQKRKNSNNINSREFHSAGRRSANSYLSTAVECNTDSCQDNESLCNAPGFARLPNQSQNSYQRERKHCEDSAKASARARHRILKPLGKIDRGDASELFSEVKSPAHNHRSSKVKTIDEVLKESQLSDLIRDTVEYENYKKLLNWVEPKTRSENRHQNTIVRTSSRGRRRTPEPNIAVRRNLSKIHPHGNFPRLPSVQNEKRHPPSLNGKKKTRCSVCAKKLGLASTYQCRCGSKFCATHRYPETHTCTFDYKTEGRKFLEKNNPVVTAPKLPKI